MFILDYKCSKHQVKTESFSDKNVLISFISEESINNDYFRVVCLNFYSLGKLVKYEVVFNGRLEVREFIEKPQDHIPKHSPLIKEVFK